jgi:sarcosine oxidase
MARFDVVVCGLGAMGSAALYRLARAGARVLGIDRYPASHDCGSSHGLTRVIRLGYFEHPSYVPLLRRAYTLWRELEATAGRPLLHITGIAEIGAPDSVLVRGTLASSQRHGLRHEVLEANELMQRFPAFRLPPDFVGVLQPDGGFVEVEPTLEALNMLAAAAGAEIHRNEIVRSIEPESGGVRVTTDREIIVTAKAIVVAGAWTTSLLPSLPLRATREVTGWFEPVDPAAVSPGKFPVFLIEGRHGMHYGIPPHGGAGVKVAKHHHRDQTVDPGTYDRTVSADDEALIRGVLAGHIPAANGPLLAAKTCLYTMTPDSDFIIDRMPDARNVIVASPCSGHGFKFAPVIGEILADLALNDATQHDISRFGLARFE